MEIWPTSWCCWAGSPCWRSRSGGCSQNVIGGLLALALVVHLFVTLVRPERF
jgi:K+-transporting ATPase KdpF subunit